MHTYIILYITVCLIIQLNLPHSIFILIRTELIYFRMLTCSCEKAVTYQSKINALEHFIFEITFQHHKKLLTSKFSFVCRLVN